MFTASPKEPAIGFILSNTSPVDRLTHDILFKKKKLNIIVTSTLKYTKLSLFSKVFFYKAPLCICLLPKRAICCTYLISLDTLMLIICDKN